MRRVLRDIPQADESMAAEASAPQPEASAASAPSGGIGFYPLLSMALIVSIALPWIAWMLLREPELTPYEKSEKAVDLLDQGRTRSGYVLAMELLHDGVRDPDIGGSLEYVVGVAHFRKADEVDSEMGKQAAGITMPIFDLARRYLEQARRKTIRPELRAEWAYSLGSCYFKLGRLYEARELLEEAYEINFDFRDEATFKLAECYLDPNVLADSLDVPNDRMEAQKVRQRMLDRVTEVLDQPEKKRLNELKYTQLRVYQAEYCLLQDQYTQMQDALDKVHPETLGDDVSDEDRNLLQDSVRLTKARALLQQGKTKAARDVLQELIQEKSGLEQNATMLAHYIIGRAYAQDKSFDLALDHLEKPARVTESVICFPANLYAGDIARKRGLHEEALAYYIKALEQVTSTEEFTNRWINLVTARSLVQAAWDDWGSSGRYEHFRFATDLAGHVVPLFTQSYSNRLLALATRKRAEFIQEETDALQPHVDDDQRRRALEHWKRAGQAYARLADSTAASDAYSGNLWEASQLYRRGHDFASALKMVNRYIDSNPLTGLPAAYVFKARLLMDLDPYSNQENLDQAIAVLEMLLRDYPKDQFIYEAQILLGDIYLEMGENEQAIEIWRELLLKSPLTPEATEWQDALFSLGRTLFLISDARPEILQAATTDEAAEKQAALNYERVDEAIQWLDEFVRRRPQHPRAFEARWLLAKGLRFRIQKPADHIEHAETENTRIELNNEINSLAARAIAEFERLGDDLAVLEQQDLLNQVTAQFLRDAYFEPAHIQYRLGRYDSTGDAYRKAIDLYSNAAFHFTGSPTVLIAYYRIAECYRELGAEAEARRQLEQARVILQQLPDPFSEQSTNFNRQQWESLLEQSIRLYDLALDPEAAAAR